MKDIPGYEGRYAATKDGHIWSFPKQSNANPIGMFKKQVLKKLGYLQIGLIIDGKEKKFLSHRLIALTFIPNPLNFKEVNHKNGIKTDNRVQNLEWCNRSSNMKHAFRIGLRDHSGDNNPRWKKRKGLCS